MKLLKKGDYALEDVLIRGQAGLDTSDIVSNIIFSVKMGGETRPSSITASCLMVQKSIPLK